MTREDYLALLKDYPDWMSAGDVQRFMEYKLRETAHQLMHTKKGALATRDFPLEPKTPGWKGYRVHKGNFAVWMAECRKK